MSDVQMSEILRSNALTMIDEIFNQVHGAMLDDGESLMPTVNSISAEQASVVHAPGTGSIAAHVDHVAFYIKVILDDIKGADWSQSWQITTVSNAEWSNLRSNLDNGYERMKRYVSQVTLWDDQSTGNVLSLIGHCSFHLGQIREIMATFR